MFLLSRLGRKGGSFVDRIRTALKGTRACRVEIRTARDESAKSFAHRLARIFDSCAYHTRIIDDPDSGREGVHLKTHPKNAASALAIQSAFHGASIDCLLSVDNKLLPDVVVLHVGANAMSHT
jgi:hypothetical protein